VQQKAHLSVFLAAPLFIVPAVLPGAGLIPAWDAPAQEVNTNRRAHADEANRRISGAAKSAGITAEIYVSQDYYADLRESLLASARPSDVIILPQPEQYLALERHLVEAVLFTSGRPVVLVPPGWARGARLAKVIIAWDGGGRSARAVGDALPLLECADEAEIVCVSHNAGKNIPNAALAAHLRRHCKKVTCTELPVQRGGIGETLRAHAAATGASLLVMGAYAHSRIWETVLGGVTADMFANAELPLLLSH
jgi:nucleotide-binding universal stress UspA family protein